MKKKSSLKKAVVFTALFGTAVAFGGVEASAHGYVKSPASRGYLGEIEKNDKKPGSHDKALSKYGKVIYSPQSLEYPKGFPVGGPEDGHIASASVSGVPNPQIGDQLLDKQSPTLWPKTDISTGESSMTWYFTASHKLAKFHYYITKQGWNQNAPLTRDSFDLHPIGVFNGDKDEKDDAKDYPTHTINIPKDRSGYHVILAIWDVADTNNAFYNVIDVNVKGGDVIVKPDQPKDVKTTNVTKTTVDLEWKGDTKAKEYNIYRDGVKVGTSPSSQFKDKGLKPNTTYKYEIEAIGHDGSKSVKSKALSVTTKKESEKLPPTTPSGLHTMGVTTSLVDLMWTASKHESGIKHYEIWRDGKQIGTSNAATYKDGEQKELTPGTTYKYKVRAVSNENTKSKFSNEIKVTTKSNGGGDYPEFKVGTFINPTSYTAGEKVSYKGKNYEVIVTHKNYGDKTWAPDVVNSTLFKQI